MARSRGAAALLSLAGALACTPGLNWPNGDLPGMPVPLPAGSDPAALCASMCAAEPQCVLSVLLPAGCDTSAAGAAVCYLKGSRTPQTNESCTCGALVSRATFPAPPAGAPLFTITAEHVTAALGANGLVSLAVGGAGSVGVSLDTWALALDGLVVNSSGLPPPAVAQPDPGSVRYVYTAPPGYTVTVVYEARPGWRFLRKTVAVASLDGAPLYIASVSPWDALVLALPAPLAGAVFPSGDMGVYGVFGRLADGTGLLAAATNPFLYPTLAPLSGNAALVHVGYHPALLWNQTTPGGAPPQPYVADGGLLGLYPLSPHAVPPPLDTEPGSSRYVAATRAYAGAMASRATDTHAGMLVEYVALGGDVPDGLHRHAGRPADPSWLNYADRKSVV